jgi:SagB-type dehydrogenase family enzyme
MRKDYGLEFQQQSKDHTMGGLVSIPLNPSDWPEDWKKVEYKQYRYAKKIELPNPIPGLLSQDKLAQRETVRSYRSDHTLTKQTVSNLLAYSCGRVTSRGQSDERRVQPSGGGRYPLELYLLNFRPGELDMCSYHYDVRVHALEEMWPLNLAQMPLREAFTYPWSTQATGIAVITAVPGRTTRKYGERGYRYIYLEAGIVLGNLIQACLIEGLGTAVLGGIDDYKMEEYLDLDGREETVVAGLVIGKK